MSFEIKDVHSENYKPIIEFYSKYGDRSYNWYDKKLKNEIISGTIIGKICIIKETNQIVASYLCRIQPLLSNPSLKSVQSIDTLTAPSHRKGSITAKLAKEFYEYLRTESFDCIYGLPNLRADKFFYRILKWNLSRETYSYHVFIPVFILRFLYSFINFFTKGKNFFNYSFEKINHLNKKLIINSNCVENQNRGAYWVSYEHAFFTNIGLCRTGRNLNIFDKLYLLTMMSSVAKSFFLRTYSTNQTETAQIFSPFSFKKKARDFSGVILKNDCKFSFGEQSFEFVEFDTFGLE